jgi:hypothetical protein
MKKTSTSRAELIDSWRKAVRIAMLEAALRRCIPADSEAARLKHTALLPWPSEAKL